MTGSTEIVVERLEPDFRARVLLWAGSALLLSLAVMRSTALHGLVWNGDPLLPLGVAAFGLTLAATACLAWRAIPDGTTRLIHATLAILLGLVLSGIRGRAGDTVVQLLAVAAFSLAAAGAVSLAGRLDRGLQPVLSVALAGLAAAVIVDLVWHAHGPYAVVPVLVALLLYEGLAARRIERLAVGGGRLPAALGVFALLVALVELLFELLVFLLELAGYCIASGAIYGGIWDD